MKSIFEQEVDNLGLVLNKKQKEQFDQYYNLLIEWNKVMNLTGITQRDEVDTKHFADSITIAAGAVVVDSFLEEGITIGGVPARRIK